MDGMMLNPLASFAKKWLARALLPALAGLGAAAPLSGALAQEYGGGPKPWQIGLPDGATEVAKLLYGFHNSLLMPIITVITIFVLMLLAYASLRYRRGANPIPSRTTHNTLIEVIWTVGPVVILLCLAISCPTVGFHHLDP